MAEEEILATVAASPARRWVGILMLAGIGVLSFYVAFSTPPELTWQAFLIGIGGVGLWMAQRMHAATRSKVELTETGIRDSTGQVIVPVEDIESIDRGILAFKPSNGFLIRTRTRQPGRWQPGLWWSMGRRIGIGGVTPGYQTKMMSDVISAMLVERD
ncbi:MAG: hypothetical protein AB3N11_04385, partial [Arenibacterium sp.]